jgi:hypothetical protein
MQSLAGKEQTICNDSVGLICPGLRFSLRAVLLSPVQRQIEYRQTYCAEVDGVKMRPDSTLKTFAQKTGWAGSVDVVPRKRRFR